MHAFMNMQTDTAILLATFLAAMAVWTVGAGPLLLTAI